MSEDTRPKSPRLEEIVTMLPIYWELLLASLPSHGAIEPTRAEVRVGNDPLSEDPLSYVVDGCYEPGPAHSKLTLRFLRSDGYAEKPEFQIELGFYRGRMEDVKHSELYIPRLEGFGCSELRHHGSKNASVEYLQSKHPGYSRALAKFVATLTDKYFATAGATLRN